MNKNIIAIYESILSGERKQFPHHTWSTDKDGYHTFKKLFRYLVLDKLQLTREQTLEVLERKFIKKWKLDGGANILFDNSSLKALQYAFPEWEVKPWDAALTFKRDFWRTEQHRIDAVRSIVLDERQWNREEALKHLGIRFLQENKIGALTQYYASVSELFIKAFPEWHFTEELLRKNRYHKISGEKSNINRLSTNEVIAMKNDYQTGNYSQSALSQKYGISKTQTNRILRGISWKALHKEG